MASPLRFKDTLFFGKYKGTPVGRMIIEDAGYACWLREEQKKADPRNNTFDYETNCVIDDAIRMSRSLSRKYAPWALPDPAIAEALLVESAMGARKEVVYEGDWGAW